MNPVIIAFLFVVSVYFLGDLTATILSKWGWERKIVIPSLFILLGIVISIAGTTNLGSDLLQSLSLFFYLLRIALCPMGLGLWGMLLNLSYWALLIALNHRLTQKWSESGSQALFCVWATISALFFLVLFGSDLKIDL